MKKKYSRILGVTLTLMLVASLFGFAAPVSADNVAWGTISNPSASATYMNLAEADVGPIAVTPDGGTLFAAVKTEKAITGISTAVGEWALVTSTDGGYNWSATGLINQPATITGIAISDNFASDDTMYVASGVTVFRSIDKGVTFIALKPIIDSQAHAITAINSIAMWPGTPAYVMVGTDLDVLVLRDSVFEDWRDQELGTDARAVAFAPDFATSNYIWAVRVDGIVTTTNSPGAWGTLLANTDPLLVAPVVNACIAFPTSGFSSTLWVGIDSGAANTGGVWRVRGLPLPGPSYVRKQYGVAPTPATAWDITSIAVSGPMASATLIVGLQDAPTVIKSANGGITWPPQIFKQPTGSGATYVIMAPDFATSNLAYVGTSDFGVMFETSGAGAAEWSTTQTFGGSYSAMLTCDDTGLDQWSAAKVLYGETLATLLALPPPEGKAGVLDVAFNVWAPSANLVPYAMLWLDEDADGTLDTRLTGGFDVQADGTGGIPDGDREKWLEMYKTAPAWWQLRDYDAGVISTYTGGYEASDMTFLSTYLADPDCADAIVVYVGVGHTNNALASYVDDIVIGGSSYNLEPASSAFQVSGNGGMSWNQTGLIDTTFTAIDDIAVVGVDDIFVVSDAFSLWRIENASSRTRTWARILTSDTATLPGNVLANIALVETSPDFLTDGVLYATDDVKGIMKSIDGGDIFAPMGAPGGNISVLHVLDATFAFIGSVNQVYRTDDGGYSWLQATTPPVGTVTDIALAPNYDTSGHMLVGCTTGHSPAGGVYMSKDGGATFATMSGPPPITAAGNKYVAFEPTYTGAGHPGPATHGFYVAGGSKIQRYYASGVFWETIDIGPSAEVAGTPVNADAFTIDADTGTDSGTITVLTGSVTVTPTATATIAGVVASGTLTITAGMGAIAWTLPTADDTLVVTALTDGTSGTFTTQAATTTADITSDEGGGVATCGLGGAAGTYPFSLPDGPVAAGAGAQPSTFNGLLTSPDGTLYGCNALDGQGVERSLNPTASPISAFLTGPVEGVTAPVFERMNQTLADTATLKGLEMVVDDTLAVTGSKNVFFAIDTTGVAILTYTDTLATEVVATSPEDGAIFPRVEDVTLEWEALTGALGYRYEVARDDAFRLVVVGAAGDTFYPTTMVTGLRAGETYYWRVRVDGTPMGAPGLPLLSRWSETRSFVTELGGRIWHPFSNIAGVAPGPGAQDVLTKPVFQWNGADWATSYELMLADNAAFTGATAKTLTTTSWVCDTDLGYSTTWYWKVRALSAASQSEWSDVGVFTTVAKPVEVTPPVVIQDVPDIIVEAPDITVEEVTPTPTWALLVIIIIGAVLVCSVIVLIMRTRRPI